MVSVRANVNAYERRVEATTSLSVRLLFAVCSSGFDCEYSFVSDSWMTENACFLISRQLICWYLPHLGCDAVRSLPEFDTQLAFDVQANY